MFDVLAFGMSSRARFLRERWLLVVVPLFVLVAPQATFPAAGAEASAPPGVRKMSNLLEKITRELDPAKNQFLNTARVAQLEAQLRPLLAVLPSGATINQRFNVQVKYATELLNAGEPEKALASLRDLERVLMSGGAYDAKPRALIQTLVAVCSLRLGEQENCLAHHNSDSCLLP